MKSDQLSFRPGFRLSAANTKSQAAVMVFEGGSDNLHKGADQWLYVVDGSGVAIITSCRPGAASKGPRNPVCCSGV